MDQAVHRDLKTLANFIEVYCRGRHGSAAGAQTRLKPHYVEAIGGRALCLCPVCSKLLAHAFVKRLHCPMEPKPACKHCPKHCYHPIYRRQIQEVMKYSGRKLVLSGRLDYLVHLLF